jgi:DNA-binding transcriptional LysR family regulator
MHMDELDITQIRLIAQLVRLHSVSAASQSIGLSQSAASHALAKLRKQLGDPLFTRTTNGFQPTPYGERLEMLHARRSTHFKPASRQIVRLMHARPRGASVST